MRKVTAVPRLTKRARDAHKGSFGHVLVLGGCPGLTGAPVLAAEAALRAGAGLATVGCPRAVQPVVAARTTCAMSLPLPDTPGGALSHTALAPALRFSARCRAVVLGPGLGRDGDTAEFVASFSTSVEATTVVDADGLNALAGRAELLRDAAGTFILTPHPVEAGRLLGRDTRSTAPRDRRAVVEELHALTGAVIVLKGHRTLVGDGGRLYENLTGNPGMATAGSGDVLSGVIAALVGQGLPPFEAAVLGAWVHGRAGDLAARRTGEVSLIATDLVESLPAAFRSRR